VNANPQNDAASSIFPSVEMLDGIHLRKQREDRDVCKLFPDIEGNYYTLPNDLEKALPRVISQGLLGPMDVWIGWANHEVPSELWRNVSAKDIYTDLSPYLENTSAYDIQGVPSLLRDTFLRDQTALVGLPLHANLLRLVHDASIVNLQSSATWEEYLAEAQRIAALDRNGDGLPDRYSFCSGGPDEAAPLLASIASSLLQVAGSQDVLEMSLSRGSEMRSLLGSTGWARAADIYTQLLQLSNPVKDGAGFSRQLCAMAWTEEKPSPSWVDSVVGSSMVDNRQIGEGAGVVRCFSRSECPRSIRRATDGTRINPARSVVTSLTHAAVERRSNRKEEAFQLLLYLQSDDVYLSNLAMGVFGVTHREHANASRVVQHITQRMPQLNASGQILAKSDEARTGPADWVRIGLSLGMGLTDVQNDIQYIFDQQLHQIQNAMTMLSIMTGPAFKAAGVQLRQVATNLQCLAFADFEANRELHQASTPMAKAHLQTCARGVFRYDPELVSQQGFARGWRAIAPAWAPCADLVIRDEYSYDGVDGAQFGTNYEDSDLLNDAVGRCTVTDLSGSINAMMLEASETFDAEAPRDGADRLRYANSILTSYLASTGTIEARPSLETSFGSAHDTRHLNTSCAPGFQPTAIDSRYCSPCPVGYHGDDASVSGCSRCPPGTYQSTAGQLTCAKCPGDTHVTGTHGSTRADECRVPKLSLRPTLPTRCIPPGCTAGPTSVDAFLAVEEVKEPDSEKKEVNLTLFSELSWQDPRLVADPIFVYEVREHATAFSADGTAKTATYSMSTAEWRRRGFWLPHYVLEGGVDGTHGEVKHDSMLEASNVTVFLAPYNETADPPRLWDRQLSSIRIVWSRHLKDAKMSWTQLDWKMFPFGRLQLVVDLACGTDILCHERPHAKLGKYATEAYSETHLAYDPTMPLIAGSLSRQSHSSPPSSADDLSSAATDTSAIMIPRPGAHIIISFLLRRQAYLLIMRMIVPTILIVGLGCFIFWVKDSTWTVEMAFQVLLVLTVISVEVADFFPGHVTYMSWLDYFILANTILTVVSCGLGVLIIILTEQEDSPQTIKLGDSLDLAMSWVQPFIAISMNLTMVVYALATTRDGQGSIDDIHKMFVTFIVCEVVLLGMSTFGFYTGKLFLAGDQVKQGNSMVVRKLRRQVSRRGKTSGAVEVKHVEVTSAVATSYAEDR